MTKRLVIPRFTSREEEAEWYDRHKRELDDDMVRRIDSGDFSVRRAGSHRRLTPITIRMNPEDLETVRRRAERKGVPYQTYVRMLLHESLRQSRR